ncbi:hypothetical protein Tco_1509862 [Tanacetum coccineum]
MISTNNSSLIYKYKHFAFIQTLLLCIEHPWRCPDDNSSLAGLTAMLHLWHVRLFGLSSRLLKQDVRGISIMYCILDSKVKYSKEPDNPTNCGLAGKPYIEANLFSFLVTSVLEKSSFVLGTWVGGEGACTRHDFLNVEILATNNKKGHTTLHMPMKGQNYEAFLEKYAALAKSAKSDSSKAPWCTSLKEPSSKLRDAGEFAELCATTDLMRYNRGFNVAGPFGQQVNATRLTCLSGRSNVNTLSVVGELSVDAMPTFLFLKNAGVVDKIVGADKEVSR